MIQYGILFYSYQVPILNNSVKRYFKFQMGDMMKSELDCMEKMEKK